MALAAVLCAAPEHEAAPLFPRATVEALLLCIGWGIHGDHWIEESGRWRLGPLVGHYQKAAPQYIGHDARESQRQRQIVLLRQEIDESQARIAAIDSQLDVVRKARDDSTREADRAPKDDQVRQALAAVASAARMWQSAQQRLLEIEPQLDQHRSDYQQAVQLRDQDAATLGIARWGDRVAALRAAIETYHRLADAIWPRLESLESSNKQLEAAERRVSEVETLFSKRRTQEHEASLAARAAQSRWQTLEHNHLWMRLLGQVQTLFTGVGRQHGDARPRKRAAEGMQDRGFVIDD
jgi:DNA repair exonuclease SbcCD ATPase subunit